MFEKLFMLILTPMINREVRKIKNDPEIIEAEKAVDNAIAEWKISLKRSIESDKQAYAEARKIYQDYKKLQGK